MSIFGFNSVQESSLPVVDTLYQGEAGEGALICHETANDIANLSAGLYVSDIMMESKVVYEGADAQALLEGFVKDTWEKIKEILEKLWAKLKSWFVAAKKALESFFMPIVKFVKKYEKEILDKDYSEFTYKGRKWDKGLIDTVDNGDVKINIKTSFDMNQALATFGLSESSESFIVKKETMDKIKEERLGSVAKGYGVNGSVSNISELKAKMIEAGQGGDIEEIKGFSHVSVKEMIAFVNNYKNTIASLDKMKGQIDKGMSESIKSVDAAKAKLSSEDKAKFGPLMAKYSELIRYKMSLMVAVTEVSMTLTKEMNNEFSSVLKSAFRYRPAKEGFGYLSGEDNQNSILESAMTLI